MLLISATGSILKKFLDETADMSADGRAKHLENSKVNKQIKIWRLLHDLVNCKKRKSQKVYIFKDYAGNVSIKLLKKIIGIAVAGRY